MCFNHNNKIFTNINMCNIFKLWFNNIDLYESLNNKNIHRAVKIWCNNEERAILKYGHISDWDVSKVTNMKSLFNNMQNFNDCIDNWNVSNVTDMQGMFWGQLHLIEI
jgi:hypothetical protein